MQPIQCTTPVDLTGYALASVTNANLGLNPEVGAEQNLDVSVSCATNYEGDASATPCTADGGEFTLDGCDPIVCTTPEDTTGYVIVSEQLNLSAGDQSSAAASFAVAARCAPYGPRATPVRLEP